MVVAGVWGSEKRVWSSMEWPERGRGLHRPSISVTRPSQPVTPVTSSVGTQASGRDILLLKWIAFCGAFMLAREGLIVGESGFVVILGQCHDLNRAF